MLFADESARAAETVNNMVTASRVATCPTFSIDASLCGSRHCFMGVLHSVPSDYGFPRPGYGVAYVGAA
jgi:hypothetical protein